MLKCCVCGSLSGILLQLWLGCSRGILFRCFDCCVCGSLSGILSLLMWWWACHVSLSASAADIQKDDPHKTVNFKAVWSSLVNIWAVWLKARCCYSVCPLHGAVNPYAHCLMLDASCYSVCPLHGAVMPYAHCLMLAASCYSVCPLHGAVIPYAHCLMLDASCHSVCPLHGAVMPYAHCLMLDASCYSVCPLHGAVIPYAHCLMLDAADPLLDAVNCKSRQNYRPLFLSFWSTGPGGKQSNITRWYDLRSSYRRTTVSFVLIYVPITHTVNAYPDRSIACLHAVLISRLIIDDWCSIY